ncbi:hypothetical protein RJ641_029203 [Dillenia turbinata]|uniref:Uncharacterized protein n=1 Tax=Dillenia turbinata TaxID=194707 RepID=A0AAN8W5R8_9MAGN
MEILAKVEMKSKFLALSFNAMMRLIAGKIYYGENAEDMKDAKRFQDRLQEELFEEVEAFDEDGCLLLYQ